MEKTRTAYKETVLLVSFFPNYNHPEYNACPFWFAHFLFLFQSPSFRIPPWHCTPHIEWPWIRAENSIPRNDSSSTYATTFPGATVWGLLRTGFGPLWSYSPHCLPHLSQHQRQASWTGWPCVELCAESKGGLQAFANMDWGSLCFWANSFPADPSVH